MPSPDHKEVKTADQPVMKLFDLSGRVAVVSGGSGLYGTPISEALAEAGAHVAIASRDLDTCRRCADELVSRGLSSSGHQLDLASEASVDAFFGELVRQHGHIDILVNNSVLRRGGDLTTTSAADWDETSLVNSRGLFLMAKRASAEMIRHGGGAIVNIASIYGEVGPDFSLYEGTEMTMPAFYAFDKGGMISFTRYLACLLAPHNIRVNCLSPGGLRDGSQPPSFVRAYESRVPPGRMAGPDDIKGAILFLCSDASAYVTGVNLMVDGGWTVH